MLSNLNVNRNRTTHLNVAHQELDQTKELEFRICLVIFYIAFLTTSLLYLKLLRICYVVI